MSDAYLMRVAGELADLAMADEKRTGDEKIVAEIAEIVGASSQTLQEAYLTAVRVRRAEKRARALLSERASEMITKTQQLLTDQSGTDGGEEEDLRNLLDSAGNENSGSQTKNAPDVIAPPSIQPARPNRG